MKNIVITGSSRGIGYGLAREFLKRGHRLTVSGRNVESLKSAKESLISETSNANIDIAVCDVTKTKDIIALWNTAANHGPVDIWINNAGIGQGTKPLSEIGTEKIEAIIDINIKGLANCSKIALENMLIQGSGAIYNMEGFGSDGRKMKRMTVYGTSKYAVRYFTQSLALETKDSPIIVGAISPGMVVTELLTSPISEDTPTNRQATRIFHILADRVETVTSFLVFRILENKKNGVIINWLSPSKIILRFMKNIFVKRKVEGVPDYS
jgi:short-subunit dehydrogenase